MNNNILTAAKAALENRRGRSTWDRAVTVDALEMLDNLSENIDDMIRDMSPAVAAAHVNDLLHDNAALKSVLLNGARNWTEYSWGGCALVYDSDIAAHYCTPSELRKTRNGERRPNGREEWLDVQARALSQAGCRVRAAIKSAILKGE